MRARQTNLERRSLALRLTLSVLTCGIAISTAKAQESLAPAAPVVEAMVQAEAAIQDKEPQLAESRYRTALLEGWLIMGDLAAVDRDWESAKAAFEAAMSSAAETRRTRLALADVYIRDGDPEEAIRLLRVLTAKNMRDVQARRLVAQALGADGQLGEAVLELESLRNLFPDEPENLFLLGTAYLQQERLEDVQPLFAELATQRPIPQTHVLLARTYRDFGHFEPARESARQALEMDPKIPRAHYYLGTIEFLELAQAGLPQAIEHFQAELLVSPEDLSTNLYLGMALVDQRRDDEAIPPLEFVASHAESERDALYFLGRAYLRLGRVDDAVVTLTRALEFLESDHARDPDSSVEARRLRQISQLHYQLGLALRRNGDEAAATPHFAAAAETMARETEDSRERLRRYLEDDTRGGTQEAFSSPLDSSAVSNLDARQRAELRATLVYRLAQSYLNLGVLQAQRRRVPRAADLFQQAADLVPDFPQVQYSLGIARFNSGQFEEATQPLARALALDPANLQLSRMLALAWLNSEHYAQAATLLENDPGRETDRSLQYAFGVALVRSGRAPEAERVFADLLSRNQDWPELYVVLGLASAQRDDFDSAIESLEKAIDLKPEVAEAHSTLGDIHMRHGRLEEAERELRAELAYRPNDVHALYLLANVLELAGQSDEALRILDSVLSSNPRAANARYLKGKILLAAGNAELAQIQLETAARLTPDDPEIHYQLGLALQRQGRAEEAREEFATYQSLKRDKGTGGDS